MRRLIPRTIRWQLILGTALLQCLLVIAVFAYVYHQQRRTLQNRTVERVSYQVHLLSSISAIALKRQSIISVQSVLDEMLVRRSIRAVRITDLAGHTLAYSRQPEETGYPPLSAAERQQLRPSAMPRVFDDGSKGLVG